MPDSVEPLQLSVRAPSRLAAAASSFSAALISCAGVCAQAANDNVAAMVARKSNELSDRTETSSSIVMRGLDPRIHRPSLDSCEGDGLPGQAQPLTHAHCSAICIPSLFERHSPPLGLPPRFAVRSDRHAIVALRCCRRDVTAFEVALDQIERAFQRRPVAATAAGLD